MKITVVGTGYVGLTSGTCFAELGHDVECFDIDKHKVESIQHGKPTIYEPGLEDLFKRNLEAKHLHFTTDFAGAKQAGLHYESIGCAVVSPKDKS